MSAVKNVIDFIGYSLLFVFAMGWMDVLWMFGVENSKHYTWWYLIHSIAN